MKRQRLLNTLLLAACLICAITASAYDFEVDGIYYNITSSNTVEVTFDDINHIAYSGEINIPETVTYNTVNYTVRAIGEKAFYKTSITNVTIPQAVTTIGYMAFVECADLHEVTCLPLTPPSMNESFDHHEEKFPFYIIESNYYEGYGYPQGLVLYVSTNAYSSYKEINDIDSYFSWLLVIDSVKTDEPDYSFRETYSLDRLTDITVNFTSKEESRIFVIVYNRLMSGDLVSFEEWQESSICQLSYVSTTHPDEIKVEAFAITDGKMPSNVVEIPIWLSAPYSLMFDFPESGICYSYTSGNNVEVSCDIYYDPYYYGEDRRQHYYNYSGEIVIPSEVNGYVVRGIGQEAFTNTSITSIKMPNTINYISSCAFKDCGSLSELVLPKSIETIDYDAFQGCPIKRLTIDVNTSIRGGSFDEVETLYLVGEGERISFGFDNANFLPYSTKYLYIGSGVTGVKEMQVDPETIYCYATTPPVCDDQSFMGYDAELHVPAASLAAYFTAPYWCNFTNIVGDAVPVTELSLNQDSIEVLVGGQATLRASVTPANAAPATVEWQSSDTTIATVDNGVITALKAGECDITAICQDKMAVCHVKVTEIVPTDVTLDVEHAKIEVGSQLKLTATVQPVDATDKTIRWESSNNAVATVDENGMVTAVGQGECNITAWCRGKTATCHVIVVEHLIYIALDQHDASVLPNHILTLTPTVTPVSTDLVVTSSNPAVAAARLAGNKIQVVGVTEGTATIYVNSADGYAEADSCLVTVYTEIGDVNCDGFVDITDVTDLIDYLLGSTSGQFSNENADVDHDEKTTINDVTLLIDYLLGSAELQPKDNEGRTFTVNGVSFRMARVDGGTFNMGCTVEQDADADAHEAPVHAVTLSTYLIGQTEVTQELWQAVMGDNPSSFTDDDQCPVERVTWDMCQEFISRLNELTGQIFRLPTEAEWEFAARGGNKSRGYKYAGGNDLAELAWFTDNSSAATHPVGTKKANELGLYDMCGNVNEWCADWYGLYPEEAQTNPSGPESGKSRIYRGGSWQNGAKVCRVTRRNYFAPGAIRNYMGLRLAL